MIRPILLILLLATVSLAVESGGPPAPRPTRAEARQRIDEVMRAEATQLRDLQKRFDRALDETEALRIQSEIEALHRSTERTMLRLQLDVLLERGESAQTERLRASLAALDELTSATP